MNTRTLIVFFFSVFLMSSAVFSQTKNELESQRNKYRTIIAQLNTLLFNEKKKEKNALEDLRDLKLKIDARNKLIATINQEAQLLSREIVANQKKINKLNKKLTDLKADYGDMIFKSYRSKSQQSRMMFILSSQNFYQAYKRLEYMKQYTSFRKKQGEEIIVQTTIIEGLKDSLLYQKKVKDTLILSELNEKKEIEKDKGEQEGLISEIKKKESKYKKQLQENIKEDKRIAAKIDKIIKDEIEKANRLALANAKKNDVVKNPIVTKESEFFLTPEAKALAAEFEQNRGRLPWPVREGLVVRKFGEQPHPTFPGISINGTGLHIVTSRDSNAEAIFNGEVMNILLGSGGTKNVLIRHGNYISSYNNLENTYVQKGDRIVTGQKIGRIFTDKVTAKTTLIFVLFKNTTRLNPASWILPR